MMTWRKAMKLRTTLTVSLPLELGLWLDKWCEEWGTSKSGVIQGLVRAFMDREETAKGDREYKAMKEKSERP